MFFGRRQDPYGAYAAVIPLFVKKLLAHEPVQLMAMGNIRATLLISTM